MNFDPLDVLLEIDMLRKRDQHLYDEIEPIRIAKNKLVQKIDSLERVLEAIQSICKHETMTEISNDRHIIMRCDACGKENQI